MRVARGFTIVEVLVVLVVLNVGLLGLATTAAVVTRMIHHGRSATTAAALASMRLETLRVEGCGSAGGRETRHGTTIEWAVSRPPFPRARMVRVTMQRVDARRLRDSLTTILFCP